MKFPRIDTTLGWTILFSIPVALVIMIFFGLVYLVSWWAAFIILFGLTILFLHPVVKEITTTGLTPDLDDVIETAIDMLTEEDEDETDKEITLDDSLDY